MSRGCTQRSKMNTRALGKQTIATSYNVTLSFSFLYFTKRFHISDYSALNSLWSELQVCFFIYPLLQLLIRLALYLNYPLYTTFLCTQGNVNILFLMKTFYFMLKNKQNKIKRIQSLRFKTHTLSVSLCLSLSMYIRFPECIIFLCVPNILR